MHEASIAQAIIQAIEQRVRVGEIAGSVSKIFLQVGRLRAVIPENLQFLFEVLVQGSALEGSYLEIETIPVQAKCKKCDAKFEIEDLGFWCKRCLSGDVDLLSGTELTISAVEVD